jgi:hypothetical protein
MSYGFIELVNAELKRRHPGLVTPVGWKERSALRQPPLVAWVADVGVFGDALPQWAQATQSIAGRVLRFKVDCWGRTPDETNALGQSVVRVCHRLGTSGAYAVEGEAWTGLEGSGSAILGELATLTLGIRDDVNDDDDTTVEAPNPAAPPTGGYEP